jgi:hypothetical protein
MLSMSGGLARAAMTRLAPLLAELRLYDADRAMALRSRARFKTKLNARCG